MTILDNGAVLPYGLLGENDANMMGGFNKTYKNFPLRIGVVVSSYPVKNERNKNKLTTEYDVLIIEQNEDKGATTILYRNCMSAEGLGSIADFFEKSLRSKKKKTTRGDSINLKGQDGAIVLLLCLDGMSDKGIIINALTHPDRKTKLINEDPYLEGEYNGVNIKVNTDGSTTLTFRGATDNQGNPIDSSQGITTIKIEKDGTFQADHDSITFRLARDGNASLIAKKDISLTTNSNVTINASKDVNISCNSANVTASGKVSVKASTIELNGSAGEILTTATDPVVDTIFGLPTKGVPTVKSG